MTNTALLSAFWRIVIITLTMIMLSPAFVRAQRFPAVGFHLGMISEETRFDGSRANAREEESGHVGVYIGPWSLGAMSKSLGASYRVARVGQTFAAADLRVEGVEVGRVFRAHTRWQPSAHVMIGRATVQQRVFPGGMLTGVQADKRTSVVELAGGMGVPIWRVLRLEARAGVRVGGSVTFDSTKYGTSALFLQARSFGGWLGDWRKH